MSRLGEIVRHAALHSPAQRSRLAAAGIDPAGVREIGDLAALPVMRKEELGPLQAAGRPFGGLLGEPVEALARIFVSAGDIYDPQGDVADTWRFSTALSAAGFGRGDIVLNCASYHLSPLGFILDAGLRAAGCVVIPGGVGQQELQIKVMREVGVTGYTGLPSYLLALLEKAGGDLPLRKAFVVAEPLPPALRARLTGFGVEVYQGYGTADLGLLGYECSARQGMHLDEGVVVEICDPEGRPVAEGEVGEVVVTLLDRTYPLLRFGTGDLSSVMAEPCSCGRQARRICGWMGRANDVVKVRGLFVYPRQVEEALAGFATQVAQWQVVVDRDEAYRDRLILRVEAPAGAAPPDAGAVLEAVKAKVRVTPEVEVVASGTLAPGLKRLDDRRRWE